METTVIAKFLFYLDASVRFFRSRIKQRLQKEKKKRSKQTCERRICPVTSLVVESDLKSPPGFLYLKHGHIVAELQRAKRDSEAPLVRKIGNPSSRENLVTRHCTNVLRPYRLLGWGRGVSMSPLFHIPLEITLTSKLG